MDEIIFETKGLKLYLDLDKDVDRFLYNGAFEELSLGAFYYILRPDDVFFDVGANIGIYTLLASKKTKGDIFAFEPSPVYERLKRNLMLNKINNVKLIQKGVSNKTGKGDLYICKDDAYNSLGNSPMTGAIRKESIDIISLDDFCADEGIKKIDILKIDTEGADYLVLQGAKSILESCPIIFCEVNRNTITGFNYSLEEYLKFIENMGYGIFEINRHTKKLQNFNLQSGGGEILCLNENHFERTDIRNLMDGTY